MDLLGCILAVVVTAANVQDRAVVRRVLHETQYTVPTLEKILVDGGYRGPQVTAAATAFDGVVEVVPRSDHAKGFEVIPKRWIVERTFGWLNRYRRLSKEYDRNPESARAGIHVASLQRMAARLAG